MWVDVPKLPSDDVTMDNANASDAEEGRALSPEVPSTPVLAPKDRTVSVPATPMVLTTPRAASPPPDPLAHLYDPLLAPKLAHAPRGRYVWFFNWFLPCSS